MSHNSEDKSVLTRSDPIHVSCHTKPVESCSVSGATFACTIRRDFLSRMTKRIPTPRSKSYANSASGVMGTFGSALNSTVTLLPCSRIKSTGYHYQQAQFDLHRDERWQLRRCVEAHSLSILSTHSAYLGDGCGCLRFQIKARSQWHTSSSLNPKMSREEADYCQAETEIDLWTAWKNLSSTRWSCGPISTYSATVIAKERRSGVRAKRKV